MTRPSQLRARTRRRRVGGLGAAGAAAAALIVVSTGFGLSTAKAANPNDFELLALATGIDAQIRDNSLPVTQVVEFASYGAAATLSSSGVVKANAGAPYAPFGFSLPSTVTGVGAGLLPPIPPFPGFVAASFPVTPSEAQRTGGYELAATTSEEASRGEVKLGAQPAGSPTSNGFAIAETLANDDGSVTVRGSAGASAFSFGGVFDLARVASTVDLQLPPSGKPVLTGSTDLGTITFASTFTSGLKDDNALVAGQPIPLTPDSLAPINAALEPYGVEITYLPRTYGYTDDTGSSGGSPDPNKTLRSVESGGLLITTTQDVPTQGQVDGRYTIGRVSLSATNNPNPGAGDPGLLAGLDPLLPDESEPSAGAQGGPAQAPAGGLGAGTDLAQAPGTVPPVPGAGLVPGTPAGTAPAAGAPVPTVDLVPGDQGGAPVAIGPASFGGQLAASSESFYLILVLAAAAAFGAAQVVRFFAVKA